jgi:RNA-directed DNA polymerase
VFPVRQGVEFVGFRVFPTHRRLRRENVRRAYRRMAALRDAYRAGEMPPERVHASVQSWVAHSRYASTYGLRRQLFRRFVF